MIKLTKQDVEAVAQSFRAKTKEDQCYGKIFGYNGAMCATGWAFDTLFLHADKTQDQLDELVSGVFAKHNVPREPLGLVKYVRKNEMRFYAGLENGETLPIFSQQLLEALPSINLSKVIKYHPEVTKRLIKYLEESPKKDWATQDLIKICKMGVAVPDDQYIALWSLNDSRLPLPLLADIIEAAEWGQNV